MLSNKVHICILFLIALSLNKYVLAFSDRTHSSITSEAISASNIDNFLVDVYGFDKGVDTKLKPIITIIHYDDLLQRGLEEDIIELSILEWIKRGSMIEDYISKSITRNRHHFYDPTCNFEDFGDPDHRWAGLDNKTDHPFWDDHGLFTRAGNFNLTGESNFWWAIRGDLSHGIPWYNDFCWDMLRLYYQSALKEPDPDTRNAFLVNTFIGLGQVLHLLEDTGVPAHVRNDFLEGHWRTAPDWGNPFEDYVERNIKAAIPLEWWNVNQDKQAVVFDKLKKYWDTDLYEGQYLLDSPNWPLDYGNSPPEYVWGLAECSNYQFLSLSTMFGCEGIKYQFPHPHKSHTRLNPEEEGSDSAVYYVGYGVPHLAQESLTKFVLASEDTSGFYTNKTNTTRTKKVWDDYAEITIPRAVNYVTGLGMN